MMATKVRNPYLEEARQQPTDLDLERLIVGDAQRLTKSLNSLHADISKVIAETPTDSLQKVAGTANLQKARARLRVIHESMLIARDAIELLQKLDDAFLDESPLRHLQTGLLLEKEAKDEAPLPSLPDRAAELLRKHKLELPPFKSRQLDSLVRKRLGVPDPKPEAIDDADSQVVELADRIVRASVAADIQRIQKGPKS